MKTADLFRHVWLLALILGVNWGCTALPTQEMSDARQAVQAARDSGAATHAPDDLGKAESLLDKAKTALDSGDYATARSNAVEARDEAFKARNKALELNKPAAGAPL
jgi:hypothetical protein